jgi:hypothetical protein
MQSFKLTKIYWPQKPTKKQVIYFLIALLICAVSFYYSAYIPRQKMDDLLTSGDILDAKDGVGTYYNRNGKLPSALGSIDQNMFPTHDNVIYEINGERGYKLCATFNTSNSNDQKSADLLRHNKGYQCFDYEIESTE